MCIIYAIYNKIIMFLNINYEFKTFSYFTKLSSLTKSYRRHVCGAALLFANSGEVFRHGRTFADYIARKFRI